MNHAIQPTLNRDFLKVRLNFFWKSQKCLQQLVVNRIPVPLLDHLEFSLLKLLFLEFDIIFQIISNEQ